VVGTGAEQAMLAEGARGGFELNAASRARTARGACVSERAGTRQVHLTFTGGKEVRAKLGRSAGRGRRPGGTYPKKGVREFHDAGGMGGRGAPFGGKQTRAAEKYWSKELPGWERRR